MRYDAKRWTDEEVALLTQRKAEGANHRQIAVELGRSHYSVAERWRWMNNSEGIKQRRRRRKADLIVRSAACIIPNDVLVERDRRLSAPITIHALILGDPRPGFSALDRRAAQ